mgnify:FL=1
MRGIAGLSPGAVGASGKKHCIGNGKQKEVELCPFLKIPASPQVLAGRSMMGQAQEKADLLRLLKRRLENLYEAVTFGTVKGMAWFVCRKGLR